MSSEPIARDAFTALADRFAELAPTKPENAYIEQPAVRAALADVRGKRVLDAGCGPGILAAGLVEAGAARVSGMDVSPRMVDLARHRAPLATFAVADMSEPLPFEDRAFDVVVSCLAMDYVKDWTVPLAEFRRVLIPRGRLVFSVQHPMGSFRWYEPSSAFGVHEVQADWRGFGGDPVTVPDHYRSFEEVVNPVMEAGFALDRIVETKPVEELAKVDPEAFARYSLLPTFLVVCATAP